MLNIDFDLYEIPKKDIKYIHALIMTLKKFNYYNSYINVIYFDGDYVVNNGFDTKTFNDVSSLCNYILLLCGVDNKDIYDQIIKYYNQILSINFGKYDVEDYFDFYLDDEKKYVLKR